MQIVIGTDPQRIALERSLNKIGVDINAYLVTEKDLIIEKPLVAGLNSYEELLKESNNGRPLEARLNHNDLFFITHIGMAVRKHDEVASPARYGNYQDFTFADGNYFVGAAAGNLEAFALQALWNARISLNANGIDVIDGFQTDKLEYIPERGTIIAAAPQLGNELPMVGGSLEERGYFRYPINHILNGQLDNKVKLFNINGDTTLIAGGVDNAGADVDTRNVVRIKFHGFEVTGAATAALAYMRNS